MTSPSWRARLCAALTGLLAWSSGYAADAYRVTLSTGPEGGLYQIFGAVICALVNRAETQPRIACDIVASDGSAANVAALRSRRADFALVQSDVLYDAYLGIGRFQQSAPLNELRTVLGGHIEALALMTPAGSNVRSFADLSGQRLSVGAPGSGSRVTMNALLAAYGWNDASFRSLRSLGPAEQKAALCAGELDVASFLVGHPNEAVADTLRDCQARLVPVTGSEIDLLLRTSPFFYRAEIAAGTYPGLAHPVPTLGVRAMLLANDDQPPEIVQQVVKAVFEGASRLRGAHPVFRDLSAERMAMPDLTVPMHPGAAAYFRSLRRPASAGR